jgi:alpha-beta hydrolase superfamily lysophospholipase
VVTATARWLMSFGIAPTPRISTSLLDVAAADGTQLTGVLYEPAAGNDKSRPAFILVHGWTGDVMRATTHWLGQRLAQRGYAALAIETHSSGFRGIVGGKLGDTARDIGPWVDLLSARGYRAIIGAGHSAGGLWLSAYLNETKDARIKGVVYLAPMRDMPKHARLAMGEDRYARAVLQAEEAVRDGKGASTLIDMPFPQPAYEDDPRQPMFLPSPGSGFTYYYADSFLSYWGPQSQAIHTKLVGNIKLPVLALGGSRDPFMQGGFLLEFTTAAGKSASQIFYGGPNGATNSFEGYEGRVVEDIVTWLNKWLG